MPKSELARPYLVTCVSCEGKGELPYESWDYSRLYDGRFWSLPPDPMKQCPRCRGTGETESKLRDS